MRSARITKMGTAGRISLAGREVEFRLVPSKSAKKLRIRVGIDGVQVIRPKDRADEDISDFLRANTAWIINQVERVERFHSIRRPKHRAAGQILFRGESIPLQIDQDPARAGANRVIYDSGVIVILRSSAAETPPAKSLENWLRKQARSDIVRHLNVVTNRLKRNPDKVLIMGQRTKWGNCSALQNLSFNWRLIMAPEFVLQYLVTHEAVHLAVPDHSQKFWLTVRSLCPESERARQWLCANGHRLLVDLNEVCGQ
jgi:predicted metal-dependent hydrolase